MSASVYDPRLTAARPDLAASHLRDRVQAQNYSNGTQARVIHCVTALRRLPDPKALMETQILFGEDVVVYERKDGWAWVQAALDDYVGYVELSALSGDAPDAHQTPRHRLKVLRSFVFPAPDIKKPPLMTLSLNARLYVMDEQPPFYVIALDNGEKGYVPSSHVISLHEKQDPLDIARLFKGTPYLWGGRDSIGIDCSGLVQAAYLASGIPCPRDADMQEASLGKPIDAQSADISLIGGDLVFWRGHVGIMINSTTLLHANAHHMMVESEPLSEAISRIEKNGETISSIKRVFR